MLQNPSTKIALAVTPDISKHTDLIKNFLKQGGTFICCGQWSSTIRPLDANKFFSKLGLPWEFGDYLRTDDHFNRNFFISGGFPESYSSKATRLKNVDPSARVYAPSRDSRVQSFVFAADPVDVEQAPVAFTQCGGGYVGYVGDVNSEQPSAYVVKRLCEFAFDQ